jgi:hypothetical protein
VTIPAREDELETLKADYAIQMQAIVQGLSNIGDCVPSALCNAFHGAGVKFFNAFDRSVDEYSLPEFQITQDIINRKGEDALNIVDTIIGHWKVLRGFCTKYSLVVPTPSQTSYASLQRVIKRFFPAKVSETADKFEKAGLPVHGFEHSSKHTGWKMKKNVSASLVVGIPCLILGIILAFSFEHPNGIQYLFIRGLFALGVIGTGVSILVGTTHLKWSVGKSLVIRVRPISYFSQSAGWIGRDESRGG